MAESESLAESKILPSGVKITVLKPGNGFDFPRRGQRVRIHYNVKLGTTGEVIDDTRIRGAHVAQVGAGLILTGLEEALEHLSYREVALVWIPPSRAYGERGYPPIVPPSCPLIFEVEVMAIEGH